MKKKITDKLSSFIKTAGPQWKEKLIDIIKVQGKSEEKDLEKCFEQLFLAVRNTIIDNDIIELQEFSKALDNDLLYNSLMEYAESYLVAYRNTASLRNLANESPEQAQVLIDYIMERKVLRNDPLLKKSFKKFGIRNQEEMEKLVNSVNALVLFLVRNHYTKDYMINTIEENIALHGEVGEYLAEIVDKYYMNIQLNMIFTKIYPDKK